MKQSPDQQHATRGSSGWSHAIVIGAFLAVICATTVLAQTEPTEVSPDELESITAPEPPKPPKVKPPKPATSPAGIRPSLTVQPEADPAIAPNLPPPGSPDVYGVVLGGLDKIAARTAKFEVDIGKKISYNTLVITAHACKKRPPEEPPESAAFLDIEERKPDGTQEKLFSGWMFASSPALSALEHPIYDVWVVSCKTSKPDTAAPAGPNS